MTEDLNSIPVYGRVGFSDTVYDPEVLAVVDSYWKDRLRQCIFPSVLHLLLFCAAASCLILIFAACNLVVYLAYRSQMDLILSFPALSVLFPSDQLGFKWFCEILKGVLSTAALIFLPSGIMMLSVFLRRKCGQSFTGRVVCKRSCAYPRKGIVKYYLTVLTTDEKRLERETSKAIYDSFGENDLLRYHHDFPQPFEKYDKSHDTEVFCMVCGKSNLLRNDRCRSCNNLLAR